MRKVLVLGHDSRAFLSVIRSLGRGGVRVHVGWHAPDSVALRSRYVVKAHHLPPYDETKTDWKSTLRSAMLQERFDLVIPCTDAGVAALQRNRNELQKYGPLYVLSDRAYQVFFDKFKTTRLAQAVGVPTPREVVVTDPD